jgi:hypothetical protein
MPYIRIPCPCAVNAYRESDGTLIIDEHCGAEIEIHVSIDPPDFSVGWAGGLIVEDGDMPPRCPEGHDIEEAIGYDAYRLLIDEAIDDLYDTY